MNAGFFVEMYPVIASVSHTEGKTIIEKQTLHGVSGLEPEPGLLVRRWIKLLFDKAKQLPSNEAGVIIGSPLFLWGDREVEGLIITDKHNPFLNGLFTYKHKIPLTPFTKGGNMCVMTSS